MGLFTCMPSHVNDKHVLGLEWFFLSGTILPSANKALFVGMNMVIVDVLYEIILSREFETAVSPMAVRLYKISRLVSQVLAGTQTLGVVYRLGRRSCRRCRRWFPLHLRLSSRRCICFSCYRSCWCVWSFSAGLRTLILNILIFIKKIYHKKNNNSAQFKH